MSTSKPVVFWMTAEQMKGLETKIIKDLQAELAEKDKEIEQKDKRIAELDKRIDVLRAEYDFLLDKEAQDV